MPPEVPFIDHRLRMGWDEELGYGVYALEPIPKGRFVEMAPVILMDHMPEGELSKYVILWSDSMIAVPLGWTMLYNHSDENCCDFCVNYEHRFLSIITVKDVASGQQLTVNYGPEWFSSRGMEKK